MEYTNVLNVISLHPMDSFTHRAKPLTQSRTSQNISPITDIFSLFHLSFCALPFGFPQYLAFVYLLYICVKSQMLYLHLIHSFIYSIKVCLCSSDLCGSHCTYYTCLGFAVIPFPQTSKCLDYRHTLLHLARPLNFITGFINSNMLCTLMI